MNFKKKFTPMSFIKNNKEAVITIFLSSMMLIFLAGWNSYWLDELYSVYMRGIFYDSFLEHFKFQRTRPWPLYEITLYLWMQVFGNTETATRSLSILYVASASFFLYLFTFRILGKQVAFTTLLFFTFSYMAIRYALEARYYGQMLFLTTLSSYLLLLYIKKLRGVFLWKNLFFNKFFIPLTIVNVLLMLNHAFNYLFIAAQVFFVFLYFIAVKTTDSIPNKILKALSIYLFMLLLAFLASYPLSWSLFHLYLTKFLQGIDKSLLWTDITAIAIPVIIFLVLFILRHRIPLLKRFITFQNTHLANIRVCLFYGLSCIIILYFFISNYPIVATLAEDLYDTPLKIFLDRIVQPNFELSNITYIFFSVFLFILFLNNTVMFYRHHFCMTVTTHKLFLLYVLFWALLPAVFVFLVYSFGQFDRLSTRYLTFCTPPLMILVVLAIRQFILLIDYMLRKLFRLSLLRHYLIYSIIYSIIFTLIFVIPGGYKAATHQKEDWRGIAQQIVNIINNDTEHRYIIYETTFQNFPTLDYYLQRSNNQIKVQGLLRRFEERRLSNNQNFIPRDMRDDHQKNIMRHDYLIVAFTHHRTLHFPHTLKMLSQQYKKSTSNLNRQGRGYIIFCTGAENKLSKHKKNKLSEGLSFKADNGFLSTDFIPEFDTNTSFTFELWINLQDVVSNSTVLFGPRASYQGSYGFHAHHSGRLSFGIRTRDGMARVDYSAYRYKTWYHLAGVYDADEKKVYFYVDGTLIDTATLNSDCTILSGSEFVFNAPETISGAGIHRGYSTCRMQEARLWNVALTQDEIKQNMFNILEGTEENLVGYWRLNQNTIGE